MNNNSQAFIRKHWPNPRVSGGICLHINCIPANESLEGYQDSVSLTGVKGTRADGEIVISAIAYARLPEG